MVMFCKQYFLYVVNILIVLPKFVVSSSSSTTAAAHFFSSSGSTPSTDPTKPVCGAIIDKWVYNLNVLMARAPMKTRYRTSEYTYHLAPCKNVALCGEKVTNSMAAVCSPGAQIQLVTNQGITWSMLDPEKPNLGIRMLARKGPKCGISSTATRTLQVDFHCAPGKIATNFTIMGTPTSTFCATNLVVMTKEACPTGGPFNPFAPNANNGWMWATNIIILVSMFVYVCGGCFYNIRYQEKTCGLNACPPHAKECPFYVKDGCSFFCNCLIPIIKRCVARFCNVELSSSSNNNSSSKANPAFSQDEYPNATPAYDSLLNNDGKNSSSVENDTYGATASSDSFKPIVDTRLDVDDKNNPFHGTNF